MRAELQYYPESQSEGLRAIVRVPGARIELACGSSTVHCCDVETGVLLQEALREQLVSI